MDKENNTIDFEDFKKVDLKVGKIINAENIKGYNKVLKILVDLGNEKREIISGISKHYTLEYLINKYVIVCTNLEPKRFGEHISNGMILAAEDGDRPVLLTVFEQVKPGAQVS
ncbi:MAG: methionine--tRNA ligase subunit beta [Candidatus Nitrosocosmicus sp.]